MPGVAYQLKRAKELEKQLIHAKIEHEKYQFVACSPKVIDYARDNGFTGSVGPEMLDFVIDHLQARSRAGAQPTPPPAQVPIEEAAVGDLVNIAQTLLSRFSDHGVEGEGAELVAKTMGFLYQRIIEIKTGDGTSKVVSDALARAMSILQDASGALQEISS